MSNSRGTVNSNNARCRESDQFDSTCIFADDFKMFLSIQRFKLRSFKIYQYLAVRNQRYYKISDVIISYRIDHRIQKTIN